MLAESAPPTNAQADVHNTKNGATKVSPNTLGKMMRRIREIPMVVRASISSVTRMTPICAVIAEPERPATNTAINIGPNSRMMPKPRMLTIKMSAPNARSCLDMR